MKNNTTKYKITTGIVSVILGTMFNIKTADAYTSFRNAVIIGKSGVIPDIGINPTTNNNSTIEKNNSTTSPLKPEEKKPQGNTVTTKPVVGSGKENPEGKTEGNKADVKSEEKKPQGNVVTTKTVVGSEKENLEGNKVAVKPEEKKPQGNEVATKPIVELEKDKSGVKPIENLEGNKVAVKPEEKKPQGNAVATKPIVGSEKDKSTEKPMDNSTILREIRALTRIVEKELERIIDSSNKRRNEEINKQFLSRDNQDSVDIKEKNQETLKANLSGRLVEVSFEKGSVSAEKLYVEPLIDSSLIQFISNKLGDQYNIIETFEIHFEKNNEKIDSNIERKVKVAVVKKENYDLEVYHISEDKKLEKIDSIYTEGRITFKTNHFSKFTIVEKINIGTKDLEERTKIEIPEKDKNKTIDEELPKTNSYKLKSEKKILPKTGVTSMSLEIFGIGMILLAYFIRRKQNI